MSEFFTDPQIPAVLTTEQIRAQALAEQTQWEQAATSAQASELAEGIDYVYQKLLDAETNGEPILPTVDVVRSGSYKVDAVTSLKRKLTDMGDGRNYYDESVVMSRDKGWVISHATTRQGSNTVVLLEDGSLVFAGPVTNKTDAAGANAEVTLHNGTASTIDLSQYPFNEAFDTKKGFTDSHNSMPTLVKMGYVQYGTPAANVAMNLDRIANDVKTIHDRYIAS